MVSHARIKSPSSSPFGGGSSSGPSSRRGVGVRRTSYPSGPWVDAQGNPARSPNEYHYDVATPATVTKAALVARMPDPNNWKVIKAEEKGGYLILQMQYPDCTNYEGNKILVFRGVTLIDLVNQRQIDPHFFKDGKVKSPIARFEPTPQGWQMAQVFVDAWMRAGHTLR